MHTRAVVVRPCIPTMLGKINVPDFRRRGLAFHEHEPEARHGENCCFFSWLLSQESK